MISIALPPEETFLNLTLKTSLSFIASYAGAEISFEGGHCHINIKDDQVLLNAIKDYMKDLEHGKYGYEPWIIPDRQRLKGLQNQWRIRNVSTKNLTKNLLNAYIQYIEKLARSGLLIKEISVSLSSFNKKGYVNDSIRINVPMLNRLLPEFMESMRVIGGAGFGSVPEKLKFSQLVLGPHSTCLGLMGVWTSFFFTDGQVECFVFPGKSVARYSVTHVQDARKGLEKILGRLKGKPPTSPYPMALIVSLSTTGIPSTARSYTLVVKMRGGRRVELLEFNRPLSSGNLMEFSDRLREEIRDKLLNVTSLALNRVGSPMVSVALRICEAIVLAAEGVIHPLEAAYTIARLSYAQENEEVRRRIGLAPSHVEEVLKALKV